MIEIVKLLIEWVDSVLDRIEDKVLDRLIPNDAFMDKEKS